MNLADTDLRQAIFTLTDPVDGRGHATVADILAKVGQLRAGGQLAAGAQLLERTLGLELATLCQNEALFTEILLAAFGVGAMTLAGEAARCFLGTRHHIRMEATETNEHFAAVIRWDLAPDRNSCFTFHANTAKLPQGLYFLILTRWVAILPLFSAYLESSRPSGRLYLSIGDEAHYSGLAFCANNDSQYLIPDSSFLSSGGYREVRSHCVARRVPWEARRRSALWRGTSTGPRHGDIMSLPRVKLCLLGQSELGRTRLDVGFTDLVQLQSPEEGTRIRDAGLMRPYVPPEEFQTFRYQIDIDGNSNSWPGLMQKLLSGSAVLKIASPSHWRQWYYPRLRPWQHYVPVESDGSDLLAKLEFLVENDDVAHRIGETGQELALALNYETEVEHALPVMEAAMTSEAYRRFSKAPAADPVR